MAQCYCLTCQPVPLLAGELGEASGLPFLHTHTPGPVYPTLQGEGRRKGPSTPVDFCTPSPSLIPALCCFTTFIFFKVCGSAGGSRGQR